MTFDLRPEFCATLQMKGLVTLHNPDKFLEGSRRIHEMAFLGRFLSPSPKYGSILQKFSPEVVVQQTTHNLIIAKLNAYEWL